MMGNQDHNLNAEPVVVLHRVISDQSYGYQSLGQKDYWDAQTPQRQRLFRVALIEAARRAIDLGMTLEDLADDNA